jgi:hypothetical protein
MKDLHIVYGSAPQHPLKRDAYSIKLFSSKRVLLDELSIDDPTYFHFEFGKSEHRDDVDFEIVMPFKEDSRYLEVYNLLTKDQELSIDLIDYIRSFCYKHPKDPHCKSYGIRGLIDIPYFWVRPAGQKK